MRRDRPARHFAGDQRVQAEVDQRIEVGRDDDQERVGTHVGAAKQTQVDDREGGVDEPRRHRRDGIQRDAARSELSGELAMNYASFHAWQKCHSSRTPTPVAPGFGL